MSSKRKSWRLQGANRPGGRYVQAVCGSGKSRRTITLGYLTEAEEVRAGENLAWWWDRWCRTGKGDLFRPPPGLNVRTMLLDEPSIDVERIFAEQTIEEIAAEKIDAGAYGDLRLRDFVDKVWMPVREHEAAAKTAYNERVWAWPRILRVLGDVKVNKLDTVRWTRFLMAQDDLSGRSKAILQTAYRVALKYAVEIGAIPAVHAFREVLGANKTTLDPGVALTPSEVARLLDATVYPVHRALLGTAFGLGTRPSEVTRLRWEDVDWDRRTVLIRGTKTTDSHARVALSPPARAELEPYWKGLGQPEVGHAFLWRKRPIKSWRTAWEGALRRSGLDRDEEGNPRRVIPYSARYSMVTTAILSGVKDGAIRSQLRHSATSRLMETCYTRLKVSQVAAEFDAVPTFTVADSSDETSTDRELA